MLPIATDRSKAIVRTVLRITMGRKVKICWHWKCFKPQDEEQKSNAWKINKHMHETYIDQLPLLQAKRSQYLTGLKKSTALVQRERQYLI